MSSGKADERGMDVYPVILEKLFSRKTANADPSAASCGNYLLISGAGSPRWFIPENPSFGYCVLRLWRPYSRSARLKWVLLLFLYKYGLLRHMPGVSRIDVSRIGRILGGDHGCVPVLYIGTPSSARKLVAMLVSVADRRIDSVVKIALGEKARSAILKEAEMLDRLAEKGFGNLPKILSIDSASAICRQSVVDGKPVGRRFGRHHKDWLLSLPGEGWTTLKEEFARLQTEVERSPHISQQSRTWITGLLARDPGDVKIPKIWVHGDFAPWNLKCGVDGNLAAIDWEDAYIGLPLHDVCHYFLMQAYLFSGKNAVHKMRRDKYVAQYLDGLSIARSCLDTLALCYVVTSILHRSIDRYDRYVDFLEKQLGELSRQSG